MVQWLRIRLPVQGTQVQSLVWEDSTCLGATKPMCHDYWALALEPTWHNYWSLRALERMLCYKRSHRKEKSAHHNQKKAHLQQWTPSIAKTKTKHLSNCWRNSLTIQWLRILPVQGTRVQSLVWEDSTCLGATKPERHNYWVLIPQQEKRQWEAPTQGWVAPNHCN